MARQPIWILLLLSLCLLVPTAAHAQQPSVTIQATPLFDGTVKYGEWLPVVAELTNSGADVSGRVQVRIAGSEERPVFAQQVELARGARKQVTLYTTPRNFTRRLLVEFIPDGRREALVQQEVAVQPIPNLSFLAATVSAGGEGLSVLGNVDFRGEGRNSDTHLVSLTLATLPDRPEALRTLDMILLSGVDTSTLTPRQQSALEQYVTLGGLLVLGGGPEAGRVLAGIPASIAPVTLAGEQSLDGIESLAAFTGEAIRVNGPFAAARGEPVAGATLMLAEGSLPLVVSRSVGNGATFWLALDPALTPFDAWAGADEFWQQLLGEWTRYPLDAPPDVSPRQMTNNNLFYALQNLPSLDLPSLRLLVILLGVYILIVGPLNYFLLRRQRRLELAWVTIPVITLLFSIGSYGLGFGMRGGDVLINQISLIQAIPGSEGAHVRSLVGIFSPTRRTYDLAIEGEPLLSTPENNFDTFGASSSLGSETILLQGDPALIRHMTVNQWTMQGIMAESVRQEGFGITSALRATQTNLMGSLTNESAYDWEDVTIVFGNSFVRLDDMPVGRTVEVVLPVEGRSNGGGIAWQLYGNQFDTSNRTIQIKQNMVSSLYDNTMFPARVGGSLADSPKPVLLAWLADAPTTVRLANEGRATQLSTSLLYAQLPLTYQQGDTISLPRGTLEGRLAVAEEGICYGEGGISLNPSFEEAEITWQVPADLQGLRPTTLSLFLESDGWSDPPIVSLYDADQGSWTVLPDAGMGENEVLSPAPFVSETGTIRVRLEGNSANRGGCLHLDVALTGQRAPTPRSSAN